QLLVHWSVAHAPCSGELPERKMIRIEQAKRLRNAGDDEGARRLPRKGSAYVHVPQIEGRRTADNPLRERLASAGRRLDADRIEPAGDEETGDLRRLTQQIAVVVCEALRPIEEGANAETSEQWHTPRRCIQNRRHVLKIGGDLVEAELGGNAV